MCAILCGAHVGVLVLKRIAIFTIRLVVSLKTEFSVIL